MPAEPRAAERTLAAPTGRFSWSECRAFVLDFVAPRRRQVASASMLVALGSLAETFGLVLVIPLLQVVTDGGGAHRQGATAWTVRALADLGIAGRRGQIAAVLGAFGLAMIARSILMSWRQVAIMSLQLEYLRDRQTGLIHALGAAPWAVVSRLRHARVTHLLSNDIYRVGQAAGGLLQSIVATIMLVIQFGVALALDPLLTVIALALLGLAGLMAGTLLRAARALGEIVTGSNLALLNEAGQFLGALKLAVGQNLQARFVAEFTRLLEAVSIQEMAYIRRQNAVRLRLTLVAVAVAVVVAFVGFGLIGSRPATIIALLLVLSRMSGPLTMLQSQLLELVRSLPAFRHLREMTAELDVGGRREAPLPMPPRGPIRFDDVCYRHDGGAAGSGLNGVSLTLERGAFLGIAGSSGAGKTTFADLLVGLYEPGSGRISVAGHPVRLSRIPAWRDAIAYVSQDAFLKHDSVRENLLWGSPGSDAIAIDAALVLAGADAIVARLPEGLETVVGERGTLISGGERQRLAIARALLRKPQLLILDEATNAIDVAGERDLLARLDALRPAMTIVMIAHRLESLIRCDCVALFEAGRLVAVDRFDAVKDRLSDIARMRPPAGGAA